MSGMLSEIAAEGNISTQGEGFIPWESVDEVPQGTHDGNHR